jgi:hypothetical protein
MDTIHSHWDLILAYYFLGPFLACPPSDIVNLYLFIFGSYPNFLPGALRDDLDMSKRGLLTVLGMAPRFRMLTVYSWCFKSMLGIQHHFISHHNKFLHASGSTLAPNLYLVFLHQLFPTLTQLKSLAGCNWQCWVCPRLTIKFHRFSLPFFFVSTCSIQPILISFRNERGHRIAARLYLRSVCRDSASGGETELTSNLAVLFDMSILAVRENSNFVAMYEVTVTVHSSQVSITLQVLLTTGSLACNRHAHFSMSAIPGCSCLGVIVGCENISRASPEGNPNVLFFHFNLNLRVVAPSRW